MSAADFPLRVTRGTTGTVHAAREVTGEHRVTGAYTRLEKACGFDAVRGSRRASGSALDVVPGSTEVTCRKCLRALGRQPG